MLYELLPAKSVSQERLRIRIRQQYVAYLWEKERVPTQQQVDSHVFLEEKAAEAYVLPVEGKEAQLIRHYVWDLGLSGKESDLLRKLYQELGLDVMALASQEKVKVKYHITIRYRSVLTSIRTLEQNLEYAQNHDKFCRYGGT